MPTKNPRINLTIDPEDMGIIALLAKQRKMSLSATAKDLIREALEHQEDLYLSKLGEEILKENKNKKWYTHDEVWGK